jgi:hypothetical protein
MAEIEIPDWVNETPERIETYDLTMWVDGGGIQSVEMSRDEYIALKQHLAAMRGYITPDLAAYVAKLLGKDVSTGVSFDDAKQQRADAIVIARAVYRLCPEAVVIADPAFEEALLEMADPYAGDEEVTE